MEYAPHKGLWTPPAEARPPEELDFGPNFASVEFRCKCGCGLTFLSQRLLNMLKTVRAEANTPLHINSGYRCPNHPVERNKVIPGRHAEGLAADVSSSLSAGVLYQIAKRIPEIKGIGLDEQRDFIHLDVRVANERAYWMYEDDKQIPWRGAK